MQNLITVFSEKFEFIACRGKQEWIPKKPHYKNNLWQGAAKEQWLPMGLCVPIPPSQPQAGHQETPSSGHLPGGGTMMSWDVGPAWSGPWLGMQGRAVLSWRPDCAVALQRRGWAGTVKAAGTPRATTT